MVYIIVNYGNDNQLLLESTGPSMATGMLADMLMYEDDELGLELLGQEVESIEFTIKQPEALKRAREEASSNDDNTERDRDPSGVVQPARNSA